MRRSFDARAAVSVECMQHIDRTAIDECRIPRLLLMDHAGLALATAAHERFADSRRVTILCGTGYNGGDGFAAARHLSALGHMPRVFLVGTRAGLREEPATFARIADHLGIPLLECPTSMAAPEDEPAVTECDLIIDALLGIGLQGPVRPAYQRMIQAANASRHPIVSADIPSGLDADTGAIHGAAIRAALTVTFGLPKQGCFLAEGPAHTGELVVDDIGFPPSLLERARMHERPRQS